MSVDKNLQNTEYTDYDVREIADGIYRINEFNLTTMFVIIGKERALVLDCGTGVGDFKTVVDNLTTLPYDVALTHVHVDHAGGRGQFEKVFCSAADERLFKDISVFFRKFYAWMMRYIMQIKAIRLRDASIHKIEKEPEHVHIGEGYVFDLGGRTVRVHEVPGHTRGSLAFHLVEDEILFTGDDMNPLLLLFLKGATSAEELLESVDKLLAIEGVTTYWPSHLDAPLSLEQRDGIRAAIAKIVAHKHNWYFPPLFAVTSKNKYTVMHWTSNMRKKKSNA